MPQIDISHGLLDTESVMKNENGERLKLTKLHRFADGIQIFLKTRLQIHAINKDVIFW